jgi:DNA-binding response OmpR family regulator
VIATHPSSRRIILCIADDRAILRYEQALLERSGYAVLTATSAQQALRLATMCECDAVVIDYEMPVLDDSDIALQLKLARPELILILLAGSEVPAHMLALVDALVPKLEASQQLLPMIAELCGRTQEAGQKARRALSTNIGD